MTRASPSTGFPVSTRAQAQLEQLAVHGKVPDEAILVGNLGRPCLPRFFDAQIPEMKQIRMRPQIRHFVFPAANKSLDHGFNNWPEKLNQQIFRAL